MFTTRKILSIQVSLKWALNKALGNMVTGIPVAGVIYAARALRWSWPHVVVPLGITVWRRTAMAFAFITNLGVMSSMALAGVAIHQTGFYQAGSDAHVIEAFATMLYGEARGESPEARLAVAKVALRRVAVEDQDFPNNLWDVLHQPLSSGKGCQFSAMCDDVPEDLSTPEGLEILKEATALYWQWKHGVLDIDVDGPLFYATAAGVKNQWNFFCKLQPMGQVGDHHFFGDRNDSLVCHAMSPVPRPRTDQDVINRLIASLQSGS